MTVDSETIVESDMNASNPSDALEPTEAPNYYSLDVRTPEMSEVAEKKYSVNVSGTQVNFPTYVTTLTDAGWAMSDNPTLYPGQEVEVIFTKGDDAFRGFILNKADSDQTADKCNFVGLFCVRGEVSSVQTMEGATFEMRRHKVESLLPMDEYTSNGKYLTMSNGNAEYNFDGTTGDFYNYYIHYIGE